MRHNSKDRSASGQQVEEAGIREFLGNFCVAVTLTLLTFAICEFVCFLAFRIYSRDHGSVFRTNPVYRGLPWADQMWREMNAADVLEYHSYTVWRKRPFKGSMINIDAEGLRATDNNNCQGNALTIWVFGSSSLWGTGALDSQTIPSLLAERYKERHIPVCIVNFGEEAWVNTQEVIQLMLRLKHERRKPNLVVFYDGATDGFVPYQTSRYDDHANFDKIKQQFEGATARKGSFQYLRQTNTIELIEAALTQLESTNALKDKKQEIGDVNEMALRTVERYLENVRVVESLSAEYGFRPLFFWQPLIYVGNKPLSPDEQRNYAALLRSSPGLEQIYRRTYESMRSTGHPNIVDIEDVFDQIRESVYLDSAHLAPRGNQIVADRIFSFITSPTS